MSKSHNKKRNVGLLYEFLMRKISDSIIKNDESQAKIGFDIIRKYFSEGSEINKEFKLINSLLKTTVSSENIAANILQECKKFVRKINTNTIESEKSNLINEINRKFGISVYDQEIKNYKDYATIQVLFNNWREKTPDFEMMARYEDTVLKKLLESKNSETENLNDENIKTPNRLLLKLMTNKINEKYSFLNSDQKLFLREYVFEKNSKQKEKIYFEKANKIKNDVLNDLNSYLKEEKNNFVIEKINSVITNLKNENFDYVGDAEIAKILVLLKLKNELKN